MHNNENIILGKNPLLELLKNSPKKVETVFIQESRNKQVQDVIALCRENNIRYQNVPRVYLDKMGSGHQGLGARIFETGYTEAADLLLDAHLSALQLILALDEVQDPGNIGVLSRTLFALGGKGIVLTRHRCASLGPVAAKSSAGALHRLPVARVTNMSKFLDLAQDSGWNIYGTGQGDPGQNVYLNKFNWPMILVLGNEEKGIRPKVARRCEKILSIPLCSGFDSLNVAQAGAMLMGEFLRRTLKNG